MNNSGAAGAGELIRLEGVGKAYVHNSTRTEVLRGVGFRLPGASCCR